MTHIQIHKKYKIEADLDLTIPNINWHTGYSSCFDDYFIEEMIDVHRHVCISDFSITLVENFVILIKALLA